MLENIVSALILSKFSLCTGPPGGVNLWLTAESAVQTRTYSRATEFGKLKPKENKDICQWKYTTTFAWHLM